MYRLAYRAKDTPKKNMYIFFFGYPSLCKKKNMYRQAYRAKDTRRRKVERVRVDVMMRRGDEWP